MNNLLEIVSANDGTIVADNDGAFVGVGLSVGDMVGVSDGTVDDIIEEDLLVIILYGWNRW